MTSKQQIGGSRRTKQIRQQYVKFLQKNIHRFLTPEKWTYLEITKHMLDITFWFMAYLIGSYLTFILLVQMMKEYQSQPTNLQIKNMINETAMSIPDYTLCIQTDAEVLFDSTEHMGNYTEAINLFIKNSIKNGVFEIDPDAIFAKETYIIVWKYLSMMYEGELLNEMGKNPFNNCEYRNDDKWMALKNVLLPNIAAYNITLEQLKSTFDGKFKKVKSYKNVDCLLQLALMGIYGHHCLSLGKDITFIGTGHLCFKMRGQKLVQSPDDYGLVTRPVVSLFVDNIKVLKERNSSLTIDFSGRWTPPDISITQKSNEIFEYKYDQQINIHITLPTVIKSMANKNGKRVCSNEYTMVECLNECRIQLIRNMCGCSPATISTQIQDSTKEFCTFEKYQKCLKYEGNEENECKAQCVPNCEKWNYKFVFELVSNSWTKPVATFSCDSFFYVIFTEIPKWSFDEFVGAIGGALGLYLGLDFIMLLQFVFDPIFMLIRRCISSKNAVANIGTRQVQVETGKKRYFEKCREFIKKHITKQNTSPRSIFVTYLIEKLFWIVLYTAGGMHTAYLCYGLWQEYAKEPIYSSIVLMNNKTIALPKPTLCMSHYGEFVKELDKIINPDITLSYTDFVTEYFDQENVNKLTVLGEEEWPKPFLVIASQYLSIMNTAETNEMSSEYPPREVNGYYNIQLTYKDYLKKLSKSTQSDMKNAIENVFEPSLKRLNVSVDEVRLKLGREIAKLVRLNINFVTADSTIASLINETKLTFIGYYQICFQLPFDNILYTDASEYIEVSINTSTCPIMYGAFHMDFDAYLTEFNWRETLNKFGRLYLNTIPGYSNNYSVGILGHNKMISQKTESAECTTGRTKEVCLATCRIHLIQVLCNCTPITWSTLLTSDTNLCTLSVYSQCLNYSILEDVECREKCAVPCERYDFFYEATKEVRNDTVASLRIHVKDFTYTLFEDLPQWTSIDFLAALGGMLGLWLGLNIFTVANLVIIIPISLIASLRAEKNIMQKLLTRIRAYSEERIRVLTSTSVGQIFCRIFNLNNQNLTKILTVKWITKHTLITIYSLIGIILTYQMCADTIRQYITVTESLYNFMENDTINLITYPSICSPHFFNKNLGPLNQTAENNYNEQLIQLFRDFITNNDSLLLEDTAWPKSFLRITISFIAHFGKFERVEWHQQIREPDYGQSLTISQLQLFEVILMHLNATDTSIYDLMQKCGHEVRKDHNIKVRHQLSSDSFQNIIISETIYIDETTICYRLPLKEFSSLSEYIEINVELNRSSIDENYLTEVTKQVNFDLINQGLNRKSYSTLPLSFSVKLAKSVSTSLQIEVEYNSLKFFNGTQRCSDAISPEDCKRNCKFQAIRQFCSCSPLSLSNTTDDVLKRCSMDQYKTCLPFTFNTSRKCTSECLRPCKGIRFRERKIIRNASDLYHANLIIRMESFKFPMVNESPKRAWSEFQGDFGGALSLWIAFDGLVFVNALYTIVMFFFRLCFMLKRFKQERQGVAPAT